MDLSLNKLPWYTQVGLFVVMALGGVGVFFYYYEQPLRADMATRQGQLATIRGDITKGYATARRLPEFRAQVAELEMRLDNLKSVLPEEKDVADLLRRLQTVATQSNLIIKGFRPSPVVTKQLHAEWPIALELDGTYHNLAFFFDRVGKFTRIININTVDIKGKSKPDPNSTITATCVATTFVLLDKEALAALAKKAPATKPAAPAAPAPGAKGA
jgi:type IV pilus assembly protein PilO